MFPNTTVEELTSNAIYQFESTAPVYNDLMVYYHRLFDADRAKEGWKQRSLEGRSEKIWWVMNEGWRSYGTPNPDLPLRWLAISKRVLEQDHVPSNFLPWALSILEKFDLPRYQAAYRLPPFEYEMVARDLPKVLEGLRNYPRNKLAPPIDETNWGFSDQ